MANPEDDTLAAAINAYLKALRFLGWGVVPLDKIADSLRLTETQVERIFKRYVLHGAQLKDGTRFVTLQPTKPIPLRIIE